MELVLKGVVVGAIVVGIGLLSQSGRTALAGLMVQLPILALGALWAAHSAGRAAVQDVALKSVLADPAWVLWMIAVFLLLRFTSLPVWAAIAIGLAVWAVVALVYLLLVK